MQLFCLKDKSKGILLLMECFPSRGANSNSGSSERPLPEFSVWTLSIVIVFIPSQQFSKPEFRFESISTDFGTFLRLFTDAVLSSLSHSDGDGSTESVGGDAFAPPSRDPSAPQFPAADTEEGAFERSVSVAVERWFSLFGWPAGPHPVSVPHTLRR